jgi:hypothetical protein
MKHFRITYLQICICRPTTLKDIIDDGILQLKLIVFWTLSVVLCSTNRTLIFTGPVIGISPLQQQKRSDLFEKQRTMDKVQETISSNYCPTGFRSIQNFNRYDYSAIQLHYTTAYAIPHRFGNKISILFSFIIFYV